MNLINHDNKGVSLSRFEFERIAKRLFSMSSWIEKFGKPIYHLRQPRAIIKLLSEKNLGDEWDIIQHGFRWYLFLSEDKIGNILNESRIKLSPLMIEQIRKTDFTEEGVQRKLAVKLGIHESYLSRVRRKLRRKEDIQGKIFSKKEKKDLFLRKSDVIEFFDQMLTVYDFYEQYKIIYKIKSKQDVYSMCADRKYFNLPPGWHSIRAGESWLLYYSDETII